jgi:hypothetical protein
MLPLTLLDRTMRESHDAAQELAATDQVPVSDADHADPRAMAAGTNRTLEAGTLALRGKALASGSIDATEMEALAVAASEETTASATTTTSVCAGAGDAHGRDRSARRAARALSLCDAEGSRRHPRPRGRNEA